MKDQLITFETAVLAKEKGFDEYCTDSYLNSSKETYSHFSEGISSIRKHGYLKRKSLTRKNSDMINAIDERFSAPTQTTIQRWLREVHNVECYAYPYKDHQADNNDSFEYRASRLGSQSFETFEEALENDIQDGLKLIKIETS